MIVTIEGHCFDGSGRAEAPNGVWKVPYTVPGETVRVRPRFPEKGRGVADLVEVIEGSPDRSSSPCPQFPRCRGCVLQHRSYPSQLAFKRAIVGECLHRVLNEPVEVMETVPSPRIWEYRTKAVFQVEQGRGRLCMVGEGKSLVPLPDGCRVLCPSLNEAMEPVEDVLALEAEDRPVMVMMRAGRRTGLLQAAFAFRGRPSAGCWRWAKRLVPPMDSVVFTWGRHEAAFWGSAREVAAGRGEIEEILSGMRFFMGAEDFFQSNLEQAEWMHRRVGERFGRREGNAALDLCCGVGPFALELARRGFDPVAGLDGNRGAVLRARRNAWENGATGAGFVSRGLKGAGRFLLKRFGRFDRVVVDPPRAGLGEEGCESLLLLGPVEIAYVSCHPFTLAQDLRRLRSGGYELLEIQPVDVYPQTRHVETVAFLERALDLSRNRGYTFQANGGPKKLKTYDLQREVVEGGKHRE